MNESSNEPKLRRLNLFEHARYETFQREEWHGREAEWIGVTRLLYVVVSYLDNLIPSRVLDLSHGSGLTTVELARLGGEVDGPGWHLVAGAPSKEDQQAIRESVEEAGVSSRVESVDVVDPRDLSRYPDSSFDVVLAPTIFQDFPEVDDRHRATSEISRVLRDDGWAVLIAEMCEGWTLDHESVGDPSSDAHGHESSGYRDSCFSVFRDIGALLDPAGLSFPLGYSTVYVGLAETVENEVWSHLRDTDESAFDRYLIDLEQREYEQEPEDGLVELIVVARKWNLERSRNRPILVADQTGRSKMRTLQAEQVLDLRQAADGWHVLNVSVGPNHDPILLLSETGLVQRIPYSDRPHALCQILHFTPDGRRRLDLPVLEQHPSYRHIQPLGTRSWLVIDSRTVDRRTRNARVYDDTGTLVHSFYAGDGIEHAFTTEDGHIWLSYFDEGVFGGMDEFGPSGLICLDESGSPLFRFNDLADQSRSEPMPKHLFDNPISDCYAFNVESDEIVWAYYYTDFPLVRIKAGVIDTLYPSIPVRGSHAFAVHKERALFAGQYRDSETLFHVSLRSMAVQSFIPVDETGNPFSFHRSGTVGRGSRLYLGTDESLYMIDLADVRP